MGCLALTTSPTHGETPLQKVESGQEIKINGSYKVMAITSKNGGQIVEFKAKSGSSVENFVLMVRNLTLKLKEGSAYDISGVVVQDQATKRYEALQVFVTLDGWNGKMGVWLLSEKESSFNPRGTTYLQMHNASNDFLIL